MHTLLRYTSPHPSRYLPIHTLGVGRRAHAQHHVCPGKHLLDVHCPVGGRDLLEHVQEDLEALLLERDRHRLHQQIVRPCLVAVADEDTDVLG